MILPKNNQKSYGVLHTENYFSFTGFSKKVTSDEIQSVDIYLDDVLINTILADKKLQKIEDIYDIDGFGFEYNLDEKYIGKKSLISFKNHETKENLQNSPYELLDMNHQKFNEATFLYSLAQPINEKQFKNIYSPNSIGFLATEDNLRNKNFTNYIQEISVKFPQLTLKAFYFNDNQKKSCTNIFNSKIRLFELKNMHTLINETTIYLCNGESSQDYLVYQRIKSFIYSLYINIEFLSKILSINMVDNLNNSRSELNLKQNIEYSSTGKLANFSLIDIFLNESVEMQQRIIYTV